MITVPITCIASDQNGNLVAGAVYTAVLNQPEIYQGFVVPETVTATSNALGVAVLNLWPNALGVAGSMYTIRAVNPDTQDRFLNATVAVPNAPCNLHDIITSVPYPAIDAAQQALAGAQAALVLTNADVVLTHADADQTALDAIATAADRVQTALDAVATAADRVQTGLDATATAADVLLTAADAAATAADRIAVGINADLAAAGVASASSRSGKDANGIYTTVEYRRADNTLIRRSVLSGGTSPAYTTRTETVYATDGTTVTSTLVFTLTYSGEEFISEDLA